MFTELCKYANKAVFVTRFIFHELTLHWNCVLAYVQIALAMARMHERKNIGKMILCPRKSSDPAAEVEPVP